MQKFNYQKSNKATGKIYIGLDHGYGNIKEEEEKNTSLSLICLNAGIVFRDIKRNVSSIILASGKYE